MGDFGVKLSQAGKSVTQAGDADLVWSSSWPVLKILFQGRIQSSISSSPTVILQHGLGYPPLFLAYSIRNGSNFSIFREIISADEKNIYYSAAGGGGGIGAIDFALYVWDVDISKTVTTRSIDLGKATETGIDRNFGIKLAKEGKDINSQKLKDYIFHSSARGPMLHAVTAGSPNKPNATNNSLFGDFEYTHTLPYNPMFLAYVKNATVTGAYTLANNFAGLTANKQTITLTGLSRNLKQEGSIVVLKDPFEVDNITKVSV